MRNILNNIFVVFALIAFILVGCNPKGSDDPATLQDAQGNSNDSTTQTPKKPIPAKPADNVAQANEAQKQIVIDALKQKAASEQAIQKGKVEKNDQYGMKDGAFKKLTNTANNKTYDDDGNKSLRATFYASLDWIEKTIEDFGKIIVQIEADAANKGTWNADLIKAGQNIQEELGKATTQIDVKKDKLNSLSLEKLNALKSNLEKIEQSKKTWKTFVDGIIADHTADKGSIKNDVAKLVAHIKISYDKDIKAALQSTKDTGTEIKKIIDEIK
ncbi:Antigen P35 (plasmid) [Borrelia nietonii YOR]|uniref:Antigen P35 n=1 Tax=Borrelia nietonii YOR TaxID=1293576 RepID=W5SA31_9SPIR|nr:complement regulator-acquiring protein [Borrelia nietonii]AHH03949.1 Antigen P35 [Borrelia nietonii YOR]UPA09795.1 complement regulator-acquiring protein [Borrelia nietonii YOR]